RCHDDGKAVYNAQIATPSTSPRNRARRVVVPPATKSRKSPLFRGDLSMTSAARTRSRARKYAGCWEIAEVSRKNIGHATNWLTGNRKDRISVSRRDRPFRHYREVAV